MTSQADTSRCVCADCGARFAAGATHCWLCGQDLTRAACDTPGSTEPVLKIVGLPPARLVQAHSTEDRAAAEHGLAVLLMLLTGVAVCIGALVLAPGLGIALIILATPVLIGTFVVAMRRELGGRPKSPARTAILIVSILCLAVIVLVALVAALVAVCFSLSPPSFR